MTNSVDQFTQIQAILDLANIDILVSEVHGIVIGNIANHLKSGIEPDMLRMIVPEKLAVNDHVHLQSTLHDIYRANSDSLFEGQDGFSLLLPDEDESLENRVEGLAAWCKGYWLGFLYNEAFTVEQLPENAPEIARDILEISEAAAGGDEVIEEDWALAELEEYVKVGVQLIFESIYTERASDGTSTVN